jgi:hypothetical protein
VQLDYKQVQSELADGPSQNQPPEELPPKRICSFGFGYESKQNDSCHIRKWIVEYWEHPKYGLLYRTSDGLLGLRFNDGSSLKLADHSREAFLYLSTPQARPVPLSKSNAPKLARLKVAIFANLLADFALE